MPKSPFSLWLLSLIRRRTRQIDDAPPKQRPRLIRERVQMVLTYLKSLRNLWFV